MNQTIRDKLFAEVRKLRSRGEMKIREGEKLLFQANEIEKELKNKNVNN